MEEKKGTTAHALKSAINDYIRKLEGVNKQLETMLAKNHSKLDVLALADLYMERETYEFAIEEFQKMHAQLESNNRGPIRKITF